MDNTDKLINSVSEKMGADPEKLKSAISSGSVDNVLAGLKPEDAQQIRRVLSDKAATERIMKSPKVQELMKKLMGNKNG
jgi:hypothetical protein